METRECKTESRSMVDALATASHTSCAPFRWQIGSRMCERMSLCLALGQTGSWSDWRWHATSLAAKTSFYFCPCNMQLGRLAKCRSRGLCAAPDETIVESKEWQATSANLRDRVQPGSQSARQAASCKEVGTLATSFLGLHTLSALPWVLACSAVHSHTKQSPQSPLETNWI